LAKTDVVQSQFLIVNPSVFCGIVCERDANLFEAHGVAPPQIVQQRWPHERVGSEFGRVWEVERREDSDG
jgi:hypothetical protein